MADDQVREMTESSLNHLEVELAARRSDGLKSLFDTMGKFRNYSWSNDLLISQQRPTATRLFTEEKWNKVGRSINEGEKPITIVAPIFKKDRDQAQTSTNPGLTAVKKDEVSRFVGFGPLDLYDIEQTHGMPLPESAKTTGDPKEIADKLKTLATKQGISVEYDKSIAPVMGASFGGKIHLLPDLQPSEELSVLAHALAQEMLRHRKDGDRFSAKAVETQAQAVAYVVGRAVGLETNSVAADYTRLYNGDKETLKESLSVIHETSSKIMDRLLPEQHRSPFQEKPGKSFTDTPGHSHREPGHEDPVGQMPAAQAPERVESISMER